MEKTLIRPTAFKPVMPKNRNPPLQGHLALRPGTSVLSESQASLAHLFGGGPSSGGTEKHNSLSCRTSSHSGTMSDSGRNSLSSLPTYSTGCSQQMEPVSISMGHINLDSHGISSTRVLTGPSNSDSGRSSSSKSTGSLNGRGHPSSDNGSCGGHSPVHSGADEALLVHELEEKLRERETELQHLRESLDENEVAICQVIRWSCPLVPLKTGRSAAARESHLLQRGSLLSCVSIIGQPLLVLEATVVSLGEVPHRA